VDQLARIGFIVAFGFLFQTILDRLFDLGEAFEAVLQCLEALVDTVTRGKLLLPSLLQDFINR
jgi:hypothetical protein